MAIMIPHIPTILILFITRISFSQEMNVEAVYYDNHDVPYKIERKYIDNNGITYVRHDNESSVCIKQKISYSGDTTILKESSYHIVHKKTKFEILQECDGCTKTINVTGDTIWIQGYKIEYSPYKTVSMGDTMLTGEWAKNSRDFSEQIKNSRVPSILSGQITVNMDSLILNETVIAHFLKNIPIKVEILDGSNKNYSMITSDIHENKLIYKSHFAEDGQCAYKVDTISFNADTTSIKRSLTRFDWNKTYVSEFQINGNILKINYSPEMKREIEYLDSKNIFRNVLLGDVVYNDVLYYLELLHFDWKKIIRMTTNDQTSTNKYSFDRKNRIVGQLSYEKGQLQKKVIYRYED